MARGIPVKYRGRTTKPPIPATYSPPTPAGYSGSYYPPRPRPKGRGRGTTAEMARGPSYLPTTAPAPGYMAAPENVAYYGPYYRYYNQPQVERPPTQLPGYVNPPMTGVTLPSGRVLSQGPVPFRYGAPPKIAYHTPYGTFQGATGAEAQQQLQAEKERLAAWPTSPQWGMAASGGITAAQQAGWTQEDWINYVMGVKPKPVTGVFFNPAIPRSNVFLRDAEGHIITDEYGNPIYQSTDFTDYLEKEGVKIYWPDYQAGPVSGAYTDWLLGKLGYGYGDRGVNPYARPQPEYTPPPSGGGGGYTGGGGGGGGGGGKGGKEEYGAPFYYQNQQPGGGSVPRWIMDMVQWRI